jgi:hypothetical protein
MVSTQIRGISAQEREGGLCEDLADPVSDPDHGNKIQWERGNHPSTSFRVWGPFEAISELKESLQMKSIFNGSSTEIRVGSVSLHPKQSQMERWPRHRSPKGHSGCYWDIISLGTVFPFKSRWAERSQGRSRRLRFDFRHWFWIESSKSSREFRKRRQHHGPFSGRQGTWRKLELRTMNDRWECIRSCFLEEICENRHHRHRWLIECGGDRFEISIRQS